jgi:hypothetical protein
MFAIDNGPDDIGCQRRKPQQAREIADGKPLLAGYRRHGSPALETLCPQSPTAFPTSPKSGFFRSVYTGIKPAAFCSISTKAKFAIVVDDNLDRKILLNYLQQLAHQHGKPAIACETNYLSARLTLLQTDSRWHPPSFRGASWRRSGACHQFRCDGASTRSLFPSSAANNASLAAYLLMILVK